MDARSEACLAHVYPDLARVIRAAAQTPQPFVVIYGIRMPAAEAEALASGHSETLHSRHLADAHYPGPEDPAGLSCAVDVAPLIRGEVSFAPGQEAEVYGQLAEQIQATADALGVSIEWGGAPVGAWAPGVASHFRDWGHFQLPWAQYP